MTPLTDTTAMQGHQYCWSAGTATPAPCSTTVALPGLGPGDAAGAPGMPQVAGGERLPGRKGDLPPRRRPGHALEFWARPERDHPGRLRLPGRHRRLRRNRQAGRNDPAEADLAPLASHELLRRLRALILPPPRRDRDHLLWGPTWRRRHQHCARLCHRRWHAHADTNPRSKSSATTIHSCRIDENQRMVRAGRAFARLRSP